MRPNRAERRAAWHYRLRGYRILATNVWVGGYELDLVARRGGRLVFCEVKEKTGPRYGEPADMVGPEKQRRVRRAAEVWLAQNLESAGLEPSFEVIAVGPRGLVRIADAF
jgi:putative endonuclease